MKKLGSFVQLPCFLSELQSVNCPKRCVFYNFVLTSVKVEVNLLKQFTYIYLKVLITVFQKMLRGLSHRSMKKGLSHPS